MLRANSLSDLPSLKRVSFGSDYCLSHFEIVVLKSAALRQWMNNRYWLV